MKRSVAWSSTGLVALFAAGTLAQCLTTSTENLYSLFFMLVANLRDSNHKKNERSGLC